ncbi:MAG: RecQ family zinc-binding domain-containing protein, partial [Bacteroidota bacterium]
HTAGVLYYEPQCDRPQIVCTRERGSAESLELDVKRFRFRRERAEERVRQAIRYAGERRCRSQLLLAYFGEHDSKPCGICDICTGRNKRETDTDEFISYARKIKDLLRQESLTTAQILESFAMKRQETVARVLASMLEEGELEQNQDGVITLV